MDKLIQAKNISDQKMLDVILKVQNRMLREGWNDVPVEEVWANRSYIDEELSDIPSKVVLAKLRSMVKRNIIHGCACGCRGDFYPVK